MPKGAPMERSLTPDGRTAPEILSDDIPDRKRRWSWGTGVVILVVVALIALGLRAVRQHRAAATAKAASGTGRSGSIAIPVIAGTVQTKNVPIYLDGLGTVQAFNT